MNDIPPSAIALVVVLLLVIWLFLAHMILDRREDARLQFLLSLMEPPPASAGDPDHAVLRPAANLPERSTMEVLHPAAEDVVSHGDSRDVPSVWQGLPLLFAAALRGRCM
jgi:hypothetical protein